MPSLSIVAALAGGVATMALLAETRAAAAPDGDRIDAFAAGARTLFALRGNAIVSFDASGRESARCPRFETTPPARTAAPSARVVDAEEALRLAGLPDDDTDSDEAEEILDDEGLAPRRPARPAVDAAVIARGIASSPAADDVWIATSAGVFRGRGGACGRVALPQRDVVAIAAAPNAVAAASAQLLWRSDGRGPFRVAAGLTGRPRALAVVDEEHTLIATDDAIIEIGPYGAERTVLDRSGDAIAVCNGKAIALAGDGVWTWTAGAEAARAGDRPPARTVVCGAEGAARFIATGDSVYTSPDGATWRERRAWPGRSVAGAAALGERVWIALDDAVVPLDGTPAAPPDPPRPPRTVSGPDLAPIATGRLAGAAFPWPQVTLVFAGQRTPLREGWSLVLLVGFHLGRAPASAGDRHHLAAELVRRDADLAAQELESAASTTDHDTAAGARLRAVREEREALR